MKHIPAPLNALALAVMLGAPLAAQQPDFRWEKAIPEGSTVSVHNLSGNVSVTPSTSGKVEVTGVKHGNRRYFEDVTVEVVETARGLTICPMIRGTDMECNEDGFRVHGRRGWRDRDFDDLEIDIDVKVPKSMVVSAHSVSGNVRVVGAEGSVRAGSVSGDVRMEQLRASSVRASSVSGDVTIGILALTGEGSLNFTSVSGDVIAELPKNIDADISMRSVSGELDSDFPLTLNGRMSRSGIEARIGRGGRELEIRTVSGDVRLRSTP
jgi:DUF4097 and DUF4098 domain-containing protein YvlB